MKKLLGLTLLALAMSGGGALYGVPRPEGPGQQVIAPGCGVVEGRVVDAAGRAVSGAKVYSMTVDRPPRGRLLSALTDAQGYFSLKCAEPGRSAIYVAKEEEGYPDTLAAPFIDHKNIPIVNVVEQQVIRGVEARLPPKAGRLTGRVMDAATGQPVNNATLILYRGASPGVNFSGGLNRPQGEFEFLVPPVAFKLKVTAPGYKDWYYKAGSKQQADSILIEPRAIRRLTISLHPTK